MEIPCSMTHLARYLFECPMTALQFPVISVGHHFVHQRKISTSNINDIKNDVKAKEIIPKKVMVVTFQTSRPSCFYLLDIFQQNSNK